MGGALHKSPVSAGGGKLTRTGREGRQCQLSMSSRSHCLSGCVSRMISPKSSVCSESQAGGAHRKQGGEGEAGQNAGALPLPGQARSAAESVGGSAAPAGGAAEHGHCGHLQQDGLPRGHLLGHHETLRSHVSQPTVCRPGLSNTQRDQNSKFRHQTLIVNVKIFLHKRISSY